MKIQNIKSVSRQISDLSKEIGIAGIDANCVHFSNMDDFSAVCVSLRKPPVVSMNTDTIHFSVYDDSGYKFIFVSIASDICKPDASQ